MKTGFRTNLTANGAQLFLNQAFTVGAYYFLSRALPKEDFGELQWTLAVLLTVFGILSFGIDQIIVNRTAARNDKHELLTVHLLHVLLTGTAFYSALFLLKLFVPTFFTQHHLLLLLAAGKAIFYLSVPFKSIVSGSEQFKKLFWLSVPSNAVKAVALGILFSVNRLNIQNAVIVFVAADTAETLTALFIWIRLKVRLQTIGIAKKYKALLRTSFPQIGTVFISSVIGRLDWILLALFLPVIKVAEYSFAYKIYEFATLPLLIIAPLLIPYSTRMLKQNGDLSKESNLHLLLKAEMMIAAVLMISLNFLWNPIIDHLTDNKYGNVNTVTILILSFNLPVIFLLNFIWTLHFVKGNLRIIFQSFVMALIINLGLNMLLIPVAGNAGAAISYVASQIVQASFLLIKAQGFYKPDMRSHALTIGPAILLVVLNHIFGISAPYLLIAVALVMITIGFTIFFTGNDRKRFREILNL